MVENRMTNNNQPCPSCGHCPTCGRGGYHTYPWYLQPYYPWWTGGPTYTGNGTIPQPTITWATNAATTAYPRIDWIRDNQ